MITEDNNTDDNTQMDISPIKNQDLTKTEQHGKRKAFENEQQLDNLLGNAKKPNFNNFMNNHIQNVPGHITNMSKGQNQNQSNLPPVTVYTNDIPPPYKIIIIPKKDNNEGEAINAKSSSLEPIEIAKLIIPKLPDKSV